MTTTREATVMIRTISPVRTPWRPALGIDPIDLPTTDDGLAPWDHPGLNALVSDLIDDAAERQDVEYDLIWAHDHNEANAPVKFLCPSCEDVYEVMPDGVTDELDDGMICADCV